MSEELSRALGLSPGAGEVYLALVDHPPGSVDALALTLGVDPVDLAAHLGELRQQGLALRAPESHGDDGVERWTAAEPDHAAREALRRHEEAIDRARLGIAALQSRYQRTHRAGLREQGVEWVSGWENIGARYHQLIREAEREVWIWDHGPYVPGAAPTEQSVLERGIGIRLLCHPDDLPAEMIEQFRSLAGLEARTHAEVSVRGVVVDRRAALLVMDRGEPGDVAIVLTPSPLLDSVTAAFDLMWGSGASLVADASLLDATALRVLTMLAAGYKDETIARQLGMTTRTVRRHTQAIQTALGAKSRFQAGVLADRQGWI